MRPSYYPLKPFLGTKSMLRGMSHPCCTNVAPATFRDIQPLRDIRNTRNERDAN